MSEGLKKLLSKRVFDFFSNIGLKQGPSRAAIISHLQVTPHRNSNVIEYQIPLHRFNPTELQDISPNLDKFQKDDLFYSASINKGTRTPYIGFKVNAKEFIKYVINPNISVGKQKPKKSTKAIIEFSSPNIAKPFHVGHLRSTIIGNFISNVKEYLGDDVYRLNYLGDWGTQFGYLKLGVDMANITEEDMETDPIKHLYEAYVNANKLAEGDASMGLRARDIFAQLEKGHQSDVEKWKMFREYTVKELIQIYQRIGISFDSYDWESMYNADNIKDVIDSLQNERILKTLPDGKRVVEVSGRNVTVMKSDGTSLYLARDIAAAVDRYNRHKFDEMYYVVDNAQTDHFNALFGVFEQMRAPFYDNCKHVKFGRIRGMSTRKGEVVFLNDILDEARNVMHRRQLDSPTTKIKLTIMDKDTADILGASAVIVNDLKQRRTRDYEFNWTNALQTQGDTGIKLQYTHCRLHSLEKNSEVDLPNSCDPNLLKEPEAIQLINEIGRFDEVVVKANEELEACVLVNYLFGLCNSVNRAMKSLRVKNEGPLGEQRLLMFLHARGVLNRGMRILGLKPLNEM